MLMKMEQVLPLIATGQLLHIAGAQALLRRLPRGNWFGGSTKYFMDESGGCVSEDRLDVRPLPFADWKLADYGPDTIHTIAADAAPHGFTLLILPAESEVHHLYARHAAEYEHIFLKNLAGWVSAPTAGDLRAVAASGATPEFWHDRAVALHVSLPEERQVSVNVVNIFKPDMAAPAIEFFHAGFSAKNCLVEGIEVNLGRYLSNNDIDIRLPLIGDYAGADVNTSISEVSETGEVHFAAPVFPDIYYRPAQALPDYAAAFQQRIQSIKNTDNVFACNCVHNFRYGQLEGKDLGAFYGPVTSGEVAWQLLNQTLVYLQVL